jgi:hypothetical protein
MPLMRRTHVQEMLIPNLLIHPMTEGSCSAGLPST